MSTDKQQIPAEPEENATEHTKPSAAEKWTEITHAPHGLHRRCRVGRIPYIGARQSARPIAESCRYRAPQVRTTHPQIHFRQKNQSRLRTGALRTD